MGSVSVLGPVLAKGLLSIPVFGWFPSIRIPVLKKNQDFEPTVLPNNQTKNSNQPKTEIDQHWYRTQGFILKYPNGP
jgi:hypothetical protein